jgi:hypothetical protein
MVVRLKWWGATCEKHEALKGYKVRRTEATENRKVGESRKLMRIDKEDASE